jgi:putative MFS transporter
MIGAILFGWLAERYGRMSALVWSIATYSLMSFACAGTWDYTSLLVARTLMGLGLGGEMPVAAAYISEIAKAKGRGRSFLAYQFAVPIGLSVCGIAAVWVVPYLGWQYMFIIGGIPAFLMLFLRRLLPESPRWLASHGHHAQAEAALALIERETERSTGHSLPAPVAIDVPKPPPASLSDLFGPRYAGRTITIWSATFATALVNFGTAAWLPSVYRTVFKLDVSTALQYNLITTIVGFIGCIICIFTIDLFRRHLFFAFFFAGNALCMFWLWMHGPDTPGFVMVTVSVGYFFISFVSFGAWAYTPELYPTRVRAIGTSAASAAGRLASIIGPAAVGFMLGSAGLGSVFLMFGCVALVAVPILLIFGVDTREAVLEEISP